MSLRLRLAHVARELGYTETRVSFSVIECTCIVKAVLSTYKKAAVLSTYKKAVSVIQLCLAESE